MLCNASVPLEDENQHLQRLQTPHVVPLILVSLPLGRRSSPVQVPLFLLGKQINGGDYLNTIPTDSSSNNLIFLKKKSFPDQGS